jgi:hypothetical protein
MKPGQLQRVFTYSPYLLLIFFSLSQAALRAQCSEGINQTFAILNFGSGNAYYNLQSTSGNPNFEDANLGSFCPYGTLILEGGQNQVYKCNGADIWQNQIWYRIYPTSSSPTGSFTPITEYYQSGYSNGCGGADQTWEASGANINLLSGLSAGTYYLEVYSTADYQYCGSGTLYASNGSYNYRAQFTVNAAAASVNNAAVCSGATPTLTATGGTSYVWSTTATTSSITTTTAGTYHVTATTSSGCTATASGTVIVNPNPTAYAGDDTFVDFVSNIVLGNSTPMGGTPPYAFAWTPGTGLSDSTTQFPVCTPLATTTYRLTVTDSNGCKGMDSVVVAFNKGNNPLTDIRYSAQNLAFTDSGTYLEFDLFASDTPSNLLFSQGQVFLTYDTTYFGADLISSGAITVTKGQAIDSPYYNLSATDSTRNMMKLSITHTANPASLANLDSPSQQLCHFKFRVASVGTPFVNFDSILMVGASLYQRTATSIEAPYDLVQVSGLVGVPRGIGGDSIIFAIGSPTLNSPTNPTQLDFDIVGIAGNGAALAIYTVEVTTNANAFSSATITNSFGTGDDGTGNPIYTFTSSYSSGIITINLTGNSDFDGQNPTGNAQYLIIDSNNNTGTGMAHVTLAISNCSDTPGIAVIAGSSSACYATGADQYSCALYSPVLAGLGYNNGNNTMCPPPCTGITITGFSPSGITAGTFDTLTITGCGFGNTPGSILFQNADDETGVTRMQSQPSDIVYWVDSLVQLIVASCQTNYDDGYAPGTGPIQLMKANGDTSNVSSPLIIPYAVLNDRRLASGKAIRVGLSGEAAGTFGGLIKNNEYTFIPDTTVTANPPALATITHAMNDWVCETGVRFIMGTPVSTNLKDTFDGVCSIFFGTTSIANALAETTTYLSDPCVNGAGDTIKVILDEDYNFNQARLTNSSFPWFTGDTSLIPTPASPILGYYSLLGAARHEFGHGMGLDHVLNPTDLMYIINSLDVCNPIHYDDQHGGLYELVSVAPYLDPTLCFIPNPQAGAYGGGGCPTTDGIADIGANTYNILAFPNPFDQTITIQADIGSQSDVRIEMFDVLGQVLTSDDFGMVSSAHFQNTISTAGLGVGVYLLRVSVNSSTQVFKLVKTNN